MPATQSRSWLTYGVIIAIIATLIFIGLLLSLVPIGGGPQCPSTCPAGTYCNANTNYLCVSLCTTQCVSPQVCSELGHCVSPCTPGSCPSGQYCNPVDSICYSNCKSYSDCPFQDLTATCDSLGECIYGFLPAPTGMVSVGNQIYLPGPLFVAVWPNGPKSSVFGVGPCAFPDIYGHPFQGYTNVSPNFYIIGPGNYSIRITFSYTNGTNFAYYVGLTNQTPQTINGGCPGYANINIYGDIFSHPLDDQGTVDQIIGTTVEGSGYYTYILIFNWYSSTPWPGDDNFPRIDHINLQVKQNI